MILTMYLLPKFTKKSSYLRCKIRNLRKILELISNYYYDFKRFLKQSALLSEFRTKIRYQGRIIAHYHVIEKGLSLREPRTGFGVEVINNLISILKSYQKQYGLDKIGQVALNTLYAYYDFNLSRGVENQDLLKELIALKNTIPEELVHTEEGGIHSISREDILQAADINFRDFVYARHSIRNFAPGSIDIKTIEKAILIALKTPSVCNRQTWKVHLFQDAEEKKKILSYQNGNRGFGDTADKIIIVTSDLNYFTTSGERNQGFIDGGMFCMSLIYALHSLKVGTCCLNWSVTYRVDQALHDVADISDSEIIMMMIAIGHLPDKLCVPHSSRREVEDILNIH